MHAHRHPGVGCTLAQKQLTPHHTLIPHPGALVFFLALECGRHSYLRTFALAIHLAGVYLLGHTNPDSPLRSPPAQHSLSSSGITFPV